VAAASAAKVLVPVGVALALGGFVSYAGVEWTTMLAGHPGATGVLREAVRYGLEGARHGAFIVPAVIVLGSLYRFWRARGSRGLVFLKLTAYLVLWAAGTFVLFFALFAAYFMGDAHAPVELLVPALLGIAGYTCIGVGLAASVFRGAP
jgi:hypothetical protein